MKITESPDFRVDQDQKEINRLVQMFLQGTQKTVNGRLDFENFRGSFTTINFPVANRDVRAAHSLGRVPSGYIITKLTAALIVYTGQGAWDENAIYLKGSAVGKATIFIF